MRIRSNSDPDVGNRFLTVLPKRGLERFALDNHTFRVAALTLLGVPLGKGEAEEHLGDGRKRTVFADNGPVWGEKIVHCQCAGRNPLDLHCHHIACCGKGVKNKGEGAMRDVLHNGICGFLDKLRHDSELEGGRELVLPTIAGKVRRDGNIYIDFIYLPELPSAHGRMLLDVRITHPAIGCQNLNADKLTDIANNKELLYQPLTNNHRSKMSSATPHENAAGYDFSSFVMDWYGATHTFARK